MRPAHQRVDHRGRDLHRGHHRTRRCRRRTRCVRRLIRRTVRHTWTRNRNQGAHRLTPQQPQPQHAYTSTQYLSVAHLGTARGKGRVRDRLDQRKNGPGTRRYDQRPLVVSGPRVAIGVAPMLMYFDCLRSFEHCDGTYVRSVWFLRREVGNAPSGKEAIDRRIHARTKCPWRVHRTINPCGFRNNDVSCPQPACDQLTWLTAGCTPILDLLSGR